MAGPESSGQRGSNQRDTRGRDSEGVVPTTRAVSPCNCCPVGNASRLHPCSECKFLFVCLYFSYWVC